MKRLIFFLLAAATLSGCAGSDMDGVFEDPLGTVTIPAGEAIQIAIVSADSPNGIAAVGSEEANGAVLALDRVGAVNGIPLEAVRITDSCDPESGIAAAEEALALERVAAIIGHSCSTSCDAAASLYTDAGLTMVSPGCGATILTDPMGHTDSFTRTMYDDEIEGNTAGLQAFNALGGRRAIALIDDTINSTYNAASFATGFRAAGGTYLATVTIPEEPDDEFITELLASRPDTVYLSVGPQHAAPLVRSLASVEPELIFVGTHLMWTQWFIDQVSAVSPRLYIVGPHIDSEGYTDLIETYQLVYDEHPTSPSFAFGYDSMSIVLDVLQDVLVLDPEGSAYFGREAVRNGIFGTTSRPSITGSITCTARGDCSAERLALVQLTGSEWTVISIAMD